jgi:hypothetical protein
MSDYTNTALKTSLPGRTIVVDLDGTLITTDLLVENFFLVLRANPLRIFSIIGWLFSGKAYLKRRLADVALPHVHSLPYNGQLLAWLEQQRTIRARLILATASDVRIARKVAEHLGIFEEVLGTEKNNLSSKNKRDALIGRYGDRGFEYVGNSAKDLTVWKVASAIHVANPERGVLTAARKIGKVETVCETRRNYLATLIKALRVHHWTKNLLIFVPLFSSHRILEMPLVWSGLLAFVCLARARPASIY